MKPDMVLKADSWATMTHTVSYYDSVPATKASSFKYTRLNNTVFVKGYVSFSTDSDDVVDSILVTMPEAIAPKYLGSKVIVPALKYRTDSTGYYSFFNLQTDSTGIAYRKVLKPFHSFTEVVSKSYIYYFDFNYEITP